MWKMSDREVEEVEGIDEMVLESLKPHPNLKEIRIWSFIGVRFCNWFSSLTNLTSISIVSCGKCQSVPPLNKFPYLKSLSLEFLSNLEYFSEEASKEVTFFPLLKELSLKDCPKLKGWWKRDDDDDGVELPSFPCLSKLDIDQCPNLLSMPLYQSLEELRLWDTSSKPLLQTIMLVNSVGPSTSSKISTPLSKLKSMEIDGIADLESLPMEGMRNLTSLVDLNIFRCSRLTQVHQGIRFLTSLQNLKIESCDELDFLKDDMEWQSLQSLYSLKLNSLPKLVSLPKGFQHLTSLQKLAIGCCDQFKSPSNEDEYYMPWQGFRSLRSLKVYELPKLVSFPKGLRYLTSLRKLTINNCDQFESPGNEDEDDMPWQGLRSLQSLHFLGFQNWCLSQRGFDILPLYRICILMIVTNLNHLAVRMTMICHGKALGASSLYIFMAFQNWCLSQRDFNMLPLYKI
ncbi:hypothetical protein Pint_26265 [Pistacia integerrima]|uniref:Uncharacterized protein n=1 Tax=Pistacia integerrima TaxID=434235 RepID=A0ACC0YCP4_9ROSI|nr:hypothetical protein Pint_26265 [Pistacia integerrima]